MLQHQILKIFYEAILADNFPEVKYMISRYHAYINLQRYILLAVKYGSLSMIKYLSSKFDFGYHKTFFQQALWIAVGSNKLAIVRYFHAQGLNIRTQQDYALCLACCRGHIAMATFLISIGANIKTQENQPIVNAVTYGELEMVKFLHQKGVNIRMDNDKLLYLACLNGRLDMIRYLHQRGCQVRAQKSIALMRAVVMGHFEVVRYLYHSGARINVDNMPDSKIKAYLQAKQWLTTEVSYLKRRAAAVYVSHYDLLPNPESVPEDIFRILSIMQK